MQLEGFSTWEAVGDSSEIIKLLKMVKSLTHQTTDWKYHPLSLYLAKKSLYGMQQEPHIANSQLVDKMKARVDMVE